MNIHLFVKHFVNIYNILNVMLTNNLFSDINCTYWDKSNRSISINAYYLIAGMFSNNNILKFLNKLVFSYNIIMESLKYVVN